MGWGIEYGVVWGAGAVIAVLLIIALGLWYERKL